MPRSKYRFDPETLRYHKVSPRGKELVIKILSYIVPGIFVSFFFYIIFSYVFNFSTPKERQLLREVNYLRTQVKTLNSKMLLAEKTLDNIKYRDNNLYRLMFNTEPIPDEIRKAGFGGVNRYADLEGFENSDLIIETASRIDRIWKQLEVQSKSLDNILELAKNKEKYYACIPAIQPIAVDDLTRIASFFGKRKHPIYKVWKMHTGIDFSAPRGVPIYVTGDGVVESAGYSRGGYGYKIVINHGYGYKTLYAHLSKILVFKGQKVKRGEIVGRVGSTGLSVAPHLHYEVRKNNVPIDPINFFYADLSPEEYDELVYLASQGGGQSLD